MINCLLSYFDKVIDEIHDQFFSYFFVKKIPLSRRVEYVMGRGRFLRRCSSCFLIFEEHFMTLF